MLRRLSVFAEGFDLGAAEAVCSLGDIEVFDVTDILGSLVDKSLVVAEPSVGSLRYRLLETIRQFAAARLVEMDEREALALGAAHCTHYLWLAESAAEHLTGPDQGPWFARLNADRENLRRAIEHAVSDRDGTARVLRFAVALRRYWWVQQRSLEAIELVMPVFERPEAHAEPKLLSAALVTVAYVAVGFDIRVARHLSDQAVEIARQLDDDRLVIESLSMLCGVCYFESDPERGFPLGKEAVERSRLLGDDVLLGVSLARFILCSQRIDPASTAELRAEAIACAERSGDRYFTATLQNNAGVVALEAGDVPAALSHLEQAIQARLAIGSMIQHVSSNLGWVLREQGDGEGARSKFDEALRLSRRSGDRSGTAYATLGLACLAADRDDWHRGALLHGTAQAFLYETGEP